jgi:hypothetical protein
MFRVRPDLGMETNFMRNVYPIWFFRGAKLNGRCQKQITRRMYAKIDLLVVYKVLIEYILHSSYIADENKILKFTIYVHMYVIKIVKLKCGVIYYNFLTS